MVENIYKYALEKKLRYPYKGSITTEDLFDLSESALDSIYRELNRQIKKASEDSLLSEKTSEEEELDVKISIVKSIFVQKQAEKIAAKKAIEVKEQKQKIMAIIANKENKALEDKSLDELKAMLECLN